MLDLATALCGHLRHRDIDLSEDFFRRTLNLFDSFHAHPSQTEDAEFEVDCVLHLLCGWNYVHEKQFSVDLLNKMESVVVRAFQVFINSLPPKDRREKVCAKFKSVFELGFLPQDILPKDLRAILVERIPGFEDLLSGLHDYLETGDNGAGDLEFQLRQAHEIYDRVSADGSPVLDQAASVHNLGVAYSRMGRTQEARAYLSEALPMWISANQMFQFRTSVRVMTRTYLLDDDLTGILQYLQEVLGLLKEHGWAGLPVEQDIRFDVFNILGGHVSKSVNTRDKHDQNREWLREALGVVLVPSFYRDPRFQDHEGSFAAIKCLLTTYLRDKDPCGAAKEASLILSRVRKLAPQTEDLERLVLDAIQVLTQSFNQKGFRAKRLKAVR